MCLPSFENIFAVDSGQTRGFAPPEPGEKN